MSPEHPHRPAAPPDHSKRIDGKDVGGSIAESRLHLCQQPALPGEGKFRDGYPLSECLSVRDEAPTATLRFVKIRRVFVRACRGPDY